MRGIPRVPWNAEGVFDGVSTFRLDRKGKIYEHQASAPLAHLIFTGPRRFNSCSSTSGHHVQPDLLSG